MSTCSHPWFAVIVRSRHEKSVKTILDAKGYKTSLPLRRYTCKRGSGTDWESRKPLIPGYVFVVYDLQNPLPLVTTPGFVQVVGMGSGPSAIPEAEIEALERIAASQLPVAHCGYTRIGEAVELIEGPLKGVQGRVLRQSKATHFVVSIDLLQRSIAVEIEGAWAVPIV
jgi:transcriptional antiterminator RfaH